MKYPFVVDFFFCDRTKGIFFYGPPDGSQRAICFCLVRPSVHGGQHFFLSKNTFYGVLRRFGVFLTFSIFVRACVHYALCTNLCGLNLSLGFSAINLKPFQINYIWVEVVHLLFLIDVCPSVCPSERTEHSLPHRVTSDFFQSCGLNLS